MYDAIILGGGPVGSRVAYRLARAGYDVALIEQKEKFIGERICCTGIVSQECVDSFDIAEDIILRKIHCVKLFSPSGKKLVLERELPVALVLDRAAFGQSMIDRAMNAGATCQLGKPIEDYYNIVIAGEPLEACRGKELLEGRILVVATGFGCPLAEEMFGKIDDSAVGAQVKVELREDINDIELYFGQGIAPDFFAWLVPSAPNRALVGLLSRHDPQLYFYKLLSKLRVFKGITSETVLSTRGVPLKPPPMTYGKRKLLVGAAAGQVKPTTGGGIYYGLLCADIAADTLIEALKLDDLSAGMLSKYERIWKEKLGSEMTAGYYARKLYECLSDGEIDKIFDIAESSRMLDADNVLFDWHGAALSKLIGF